MQSYEKLEKEWALFNRVDPVGMVACSSGTAALHLALECVGQPGDLVSLPTFTMIACARAVTLASQSVTLLDCNDYSLNSNYGRVHPATNTVMIVHIYGRESTRGCSSSLKKEGINIVEDMSEVHGMSISPWTDAACWSFYKNKIVAGEEGGAVYFKNILHANKARSLRSLGFTKDHDFTHIPRGHNYRMSNVHADLVRDSITCYENNIRNRREIESILMDYTPPRNLMQGREHPWVYDLRVGGMTEREQKRTVDRLTKFRARHAFKPIHVQQEYNAFPDSFPNAWKASREVFYLPLDLTEEEAQEAGKWLKEHLPRLGF